jgi:repressor LexA
MVQEIMMEITERQAKIHRFVQVFQQKHGIPPSFEDIRRGLGLSSKDMVSRELKALEAAGLISRRGKIARSTLAAGRTLVSVPLLGRIVAGYPLPIPDDPSDHDEHISVSRELVSGHDEVYALQVDGYSMIDALVNDGDIVILNAQNVAADGDMVAVWLEGEGATTLKHFYHEGGQIRLQPANPTMPALHFAPKEVEVQGRVLAIIRRSI